MMKRLTLFLALALVWGCSPDGALFEANPASPAAKIYASPPDPFHGKDEQGYVDGVGSAETYRVYLQIITHRMALALADADTRALVVSGIKNAPEGEATLSDLLASETQLRKTLSAGFKKDVEKAAFSDSKLPSIIQNLRDEEAFISVAKALFGLEIRLVDRQGTYRSHTPIDVFHDPVVDEKDVQRYEGFDPEGKATTMPFDMRDFVRTDPFFYIQQDEDFFYKPENMNTALTEPPKKVRPMLYAGLHPLLSLLMKPAYADLNIPDCYHEQSIYVSRFIFFDDHDPGSRADMYFLTQVSHPNIGSSWSEVSGWRHNWHDADHEDTAYPLSGEKYPEILFHTGYGCKGEIFDSGNYFYDKEDELTLRVLDEDPGLNPDDRIGQWRYIRTFENNGRHDLVADHYAAYSFPQDCEVRFFHNEPGRNFYKP